MQAPCPLVLLVDDEAVGLQVRKMILERAGYSICTAMDGESALELFAKRPIDAVVLDYAMPEMDGGEVAVRMRSVKPGVPIVLLSAFMALPKEVTKHVDVYMTKGEGAPSLIEKLDALFPQKPSRTDDPPPC
jgi:CheY-like chemotaxis protein